MTIDIELYYFHVLKGQSMPRVQATAGTVFTFQANL